LSLGNFAAGHRSVCPHALVSSMLGTSDFGMWLIL
jgi:hypothetical protein